MTITVYTTPGCTQCRPTVRSLTNAGADFHTIDLTTDAEAYRYVTTELGYQSAPVVVLDDGTHWTGFRPDLIAEAVATARPGALAS